jgi:hypothetical protein
LPFFIDPGEPLSFRNRKLASPPGANAAACCKLIAETDLISALPRRFVAMHAQRFGVLLPKPRKRSPPRKQR